MKKLIFVLYVFLVFGFVSLVNAKNEDAGNQNQIKTQNAGEDSNIKTSNQEQENTGMPKGASPRSETAKENMGAVSLKVEELLTTKVTQGGIGEQVRLVAQEQKQAQDRISAGLEKIDSRGGLLKSLIGPNYLALKNMQEQMEQNRLRIMQLEKLEIQLVNLGDAALVQETIQTLTEQNTALIDKVALEEQSSSLLGWLFKILAK
ncbi:hypothetical protein L6255_04150 [Candidatus Parcubacteria bacterium]|nr:hypothetical protein [Patescibacteria group bacterium]MBU4380684.1 hypothetical protein [Patescibacteria group bacterium]MCG2689601.1 hypothetical protein [Candidatus Parcubacteria bacterium]